MKLIKERDDKSPTATMTTSRRSKSNEMANLLPHQPYLIEEMNVFNRVLHRDTDLIAPLENPHRSKQNSQGSKSTNVPLIKRKLAVMASNSNEILNQQANSATFTHSYEQNLLCKPASARKVARNENALPLRIDSGKNQSTKGTFLSEFLFNQLNQ
jgi:hypothetical protein